MKRSTRYAAGLVVAAGLAAGAFSMRAPAHPEQPAAAAASLQIKVSRAERQLYVIENGEVIRTYAVAVGRPSYPTPKGSFSIRHIVWNPRWVPPDSKWAKNKTPKGPGEPGNPMGKVKMFFKEPDYYIHGTRDVDSLGNAESHGCVRMRNGDVISLAQLVMEHGGKPVEESWVRRILYKLRSTKSVYLSSPVPVTIT